MTALPDTKLILGVHPCLDSSKAASGDLYSTMVAIEAVDPAGLAGPEAVPPTTRLGDGRLFWPSEVQYGNFACVVRGAWLHLMGADRTGMKLARTRYAEEERREVGLLARRERYEYFWRGDGGGGEWRKEMHVKDDAAGNVLDWSINPMGTQLGADTGDVWYDPYHGTMMMVFMSKFVDGQFWASYALEEGGKVEGAWSTPQVVWTSPVPKECKGNACGEYNYQGHAHPGWDPSGRTLLLSYSSCARYVSMAKLTWA